MNRFFSTLIFLLVGLTVKAQEFPQNYFRSPLDIPLFLSGNFGELRSNHFHAGLDIKTQGIEGQKVYAIADGYVSRIKVSPYGYGNALYITHPNGYTSVYGHLKKYSDKITKLVKAEQYKKESFSIQIFPRADQIQVKKGEIIAYSGNTGGSAGPHLHFEIRDTQSEHPYNPLFFGFDVKDQINPDIYAITIYPLNDSSIINGSNYPKRIKASGKNGIYKLLNGSLLQAYGEFGLGIETVDRMNGTGNSYGLHNIKLEHNQDLIYEQQIDEFAFHEGRYINSHIDYKNYVKRRRRVQKSFVDPGNQLRIYKTLKDKGRLTFNDGNTHQLRYTTTDLFGNSSTIAFSISATETGRISTLTSKRAPIVKYFPYNQRNTFVNNNILLNIPPGVLYKDIYFEYRIDSSLSQAISPVYWLHQHTTPLHSYMTVSIKKKDLPKSLKSKALIVSTTDGKSMYAEGGTWKDDNISVRTRSFGGYAIAIDSIKPKITPINIYQNANMSKKWSISLKITDNLSGINSYRGTIDGKWILMEYDAKKDLLTYYFDEMLRPGKHEFQLTVKDGVNNVTTYKANFVR